ncbi:helix-turn-helix domain-containing protein [Phycicoccus endophyticus]|uniref:Helix-turn-helix domain-containing protein n=1 Tax=Phycicoccus endophyticus TaxID=1690220 RepID=A0A7G9QZ45_9MICO|nr:helix-turn-helix domain-containing protein [Phycicoccus endophyticus]NHI18965.1 helix-turn-helix domain-containing protein [Phycicoccus endophyticus]QNN48620.1 helix-turn-helix domain-containing protein [Phycicoccus endophyticus]GGL31733.1 transcriptional regulator [Phycicoccus endophyticus]
MSTPSSPDGRLTGLRLDAAALKTLAHPLRSRLLTALRVGGPATATDLAAQLGTNSGATSYHLRRLESVGLVADTGDGEGRRRLWRAATESHQWEPSDFADDEDAETALGWLQRDYSRHLGERFERWLDVEPGWPPAWRDAMGMDDSWVLATPEQARAMRAELDDVVARYRRVGQGSPSARRVAVYAVLYPVDLDRPPRGGTSG